MKPVVSGAADTPTTGNRSWRRSRVQDATRSRFFQRAEKGRDTEAMKTRSTDCREGARKSHSGAAVQHSGAEADLLTPNRADAARGDSPAPPRCRSAIGTSNIKDHSDRKILPKKPSSQRKKRENSQRERRSGAAGKCEVGLGLGLWRGECLQAELFHFHLHRRLTTSSDMMQTTTQGVPRVEAAQGEPDPGAEATEESSMTQQDQALEEEIERLLEENDDLKVYIKIII